MKCASRLSFAFESFALQYIFSTIDIGHDQVASVRIINYMCAL
ncbi:hypothetical protein APHDU1_0407 [Anaplasma phagocytophilum]|uniref:Uncharacterized protein n=1 Tax=Anaplasma phagocytophilum str. ApMUC09 TaxID=1359152 RepID=A0A0F3N7J3_ANAPH|nr:hypothetical protein APHMUC_0862 [Anaplasma phagocytophilum str. ApMUC09]KJV86857.1 hypothetical protein APHNYW_1101 [Anaplasma phagocytophilum str. ApNYW]KJV86958.1 hypothetical protein APHNYW_1140 [Anaplasma phagocytophilum str. ApNYW]KKA00124.1 hypothetical protein APHDU1_0369 [Anaplasma phagocytophilum]KKA00356.1 hypothetical protein APHDU1_0407 [Anaplasma phagocytophilum]